VYRWIALGGGRVPQLSDTELQSRMQ
jgi:hypothetical protein